MSNIFGYTSIIGLLAIFLALKVLFEMAFGVRKKKRYEDYLGIFTRQTFAMVKANLPLGPGVKTLSYPGMKKCVKRIHSEIEKDLEDGIHLSQALARHPKVFPGWYISMVRAGEESGNMEATFEQILKHHESMTTFGRNIAWPVGYFAMLILYITSISLFLNKVIMPAFYKIIREIEKSEGLSIAYHRYYLPIDILLILLGLIGILILGFPFLKFITRRMKHINSWVDWFSLRLPVIGGLIKKKALIRFSRTLGILFQSGVPVLKALEIVKSEERNEFIRKLYEGFSKGTKEGIDLASQLDQAKFFPHTFVWMVSVGEQSGNLDKALIDAADYYMAEMDTFLNKAVSLALPLGVILSGILVGTICVTIFSFMIYLMGIVM